MRRYFLPLGALTCCLAWGSAFPGIKYLYRQLDLLEIPLALPLLFLLAGLRFFVAGLLLVPISDLRWADLVAAPKVPLLSFCFLQVFLQYVLFYIAMSLASGSLLSLLTVSGNFFWILLAPLLLKSPWPRAAQWLCFCGGILGVAWAVLQPGGGAGHALSGTLFMCCATFCGSMALIVLQNLKEHLNTRALTCIALLCGGALLLLAGLPALSTLPRLLTSPNIVAITCYLAVVSAVGFGLWNFLSTRYPVNVLAPYRFLIPIAGVSLSAALIPGESPGSGVLGGGLIVVLSIYCMQRLHPSASQ